MMHFSMTEVLWSLIYALIFGGCFFLFYIAAVVLKSECKRITTLPRLIIKYDKIFEKQAINKSRTDCSLGAVTKASLVILYSLGFVLLSYYALDGCVRMYLLFLSITTFLFLKIVLEDIILRFIKSVFDSVFYLILILFRIAVFPFLRIFLNFKARKL